MSIKTWKISLFSHSLTRLTHSLTRPPEGHPLPENCDWGTVECVRKRVPCGKKSQTHYAIHSPRALCNCTRTLENFNISLIVCCSIWRNVYWVELKSWVELSWADDYPSAIRLLGATANYYVHFEKTCHAVLISIIISNTASSVRVCFPNFTALVHALFRLE